MSGLAVREAAARLLQRSRLHWSSLRPSSATAARRCHSTLPGTDSAEPYRFAPLPAASLPPRPAPPQARPGTLRLVRFPRAALEALPRVGKARTQLARVVQPHFEAVLQTLPPKAPPPWLPVPPHRATHEARHLRVPAPADSLHVVFLTPKRIIGNSACARDRGRARTKEAVRIALLEGKANVLAGHLLLVTPAATALTEPMPRLIADAAAALGTLAQAVHRAQRGSAPQRAQARQAGGALHAHKGAPSSRPSVNKAPHAMPPGRNAGPHRTRRQGGQGADETSYKWQ